MSYVFFEDVLANLGHKLNYDAIVNYAGNSFCEKSWDMIMDSNPFNVSDDQKKTNKRAQDSIAEFFASANITIKKKKDKGDK